MPIIVGKALLNPTKIASSLNDPTLDAPTEAGGPSLAPLSDDGSRTVLRAGDVLDDYRVVGEVARGGGGIVYQARQVSLDRAVALKLMLGAGSELEVSRFQREAEAAAGLDHPGIVSVIEVGQWRGRPYFTMAWVEGESLADVLHRGPLAPSEAAALVQEVATAIEYAHQEGFIHRDLKPANILIDQRGKPRVTDFGVCRRLEGDSDVTVAGQVVGTPHYMPPEQAQTGKEPAGYAADVYSLGAVFYAALTGHPPFQAANPIDVISQVLLADPVPPRLLNPSLPLEAEIIALKCLSKKPTDRYATAAELADDLGRFCRDEPIVARSPGWMQRLSHAFRRHVLLASVSGTAAVSLVVLVALMAAMLFRTQRQLSAALDQLDLESQSAKTYLSALHSPSDGDAASSDAKSLDGPLARQYQLRRWTETARLLADQGRMEAALQVVLFAVETSGESDQEDLGELNELLKELTIALEPLPNSEERVDWDRLGWAEQLDRARSQIQTPLSDFEARLFGVVRDSTLAEQNDSEEQQP